MSEHMNQKEHKTGKLQPKLTRIVLAVVSVAFLLAFCIVITVSYRDYRKQEIASQHYQLDKTAGSITALQNTISNIAKQVIYDDVVQRGLIAEENSSGNYLYQKRTVKQTLTTYSHIIDSIQEIMIYTVDGKTFSSRDIKDPFQPENNPWYLDVIDSGRNSVFSQGHQSEANQDGYTVDVISYIVKYYSVQNAGQQLGNLVINIDFSTIMEMANLESDLLKGYDLFDGEGNLIFQNGKLSLSYEEIMADNIDGVVRGKGGSVCIVSNHEMQDGWIMVSEISGSRLIQQSIRSFGWMFAVFIIIFIILFLVLRNMIRRIVNPINQLSNAAEKLGQGDFAVSVNVQTQDELEVLANVFNKMVLDIKNLMSESVEHEKLRRQMQIENLMLQINPHFIYNTMNSIVYMARMGGNPKIADFANAFISLLQSTLDVRDSIYNTVKNELSAVENYLYLQKYRYNDKFEYEIDCPEDLMGCKILNVMIQPAVENAIFHGIAPKEGTSRLIISIAKQGDALLASVEDSGIGMSKETLAEQMKQGHTQTGDVRKIGVANVRDRISTVFGSPYCLTIESEEGLGTKVIMTVPYQKGE